jgi:hypothetical protein
MPLTRKAVTLLPPHVPHDGRNVTDRGFTERVVYLDAGVLGEALVDAAVGQPTLHDPLLRQRVDQLHRTLSRPGEELHAESRLALIVDRLRQHLRPAARRPPARPGGGRRRVLRPGPPQPAFPPLPRHDTGPVPARRYRAQAP